ncbi:MULTISPECIES: gamma carbonic anhydrase family protein [Clostridium]|uniref:gamma carbonic anhydrase family protein n=1 Tax=Clostridium TaxID=1485 RepID=UPI000288CC58|nr:MULTISPECIES: gamma carbonic anhydrase family protein [Clostridium]MDF2502697.1 isoleucine patch superfamily enzyme carbonic anhydrase/acetyltransferase [Clostridium sp.]
MIYKFKSYRPEIHESAFIAESADIIGNVAIKKNCNVWFGVVIRGDVNKICIDEGTNIQDNSTLHITKGESSLEVGKFVTVGHGSILHGCKIRDHSLIGMGSIILDNAEIGEYTIIGAGSLVTKNKKIPSGVLCMGRPAKVIRELTEEEKEGLRLNAEEYIDIIKDYK